MIEIKVCVICETHLSKEEMEELNKTCKECKHKLCEECTITCDDCSHLLKYE